MKENNPDKYEDVLDNAQLGSEPSPEYLERVDMLDNVVRDCIHVSHQYAGIPSPTGGHFYASVLFTALLTRATSLVILAPHSAWADKLIEHWDYASIAGMVRSMLEVRAAFYYLCVDQCSPDEWECRWNVFNLHDCTSRSKLFEAREPNPEQIAGFTKQADELRARLKANTHFAALPEKQRTTLLKGRTAYMVPLEDIAERAGVDQQTFRWLYILLSTHVHGLPMSFYRIGGDNQERGRGLPSPVEEAYMSLCLSLAGTLLVSTRDEVIKLFAGLGKTVAKSPDTFSNEQLDEQLKNQDV